LVTSNQEEDTTNRSKEAVASVSIISNIASLFTDLMYNNPNMVTDTNVGVQGDEENAAEVPTVVRVWLLFVPSCHTHTLTQTVLLLISIAG